MQNEKLIKSDYQLTWLALLRKGIMLYPTHSSFDIKFDLWESFPCSDIRMSPQQTPTTFHKSPSSPPLSFLEPVKETPSTSFPRRFATPSCHASFFQTVWWSFQTSHLDDAVSSNRNFSNFPSIDARSSIFKTSRPHLLHLYPCNPLLRRRPVCLLPCFLKHV